MPKNDLRIILEICTLLCWQGWFFLLWMLPNFRKALSKFLISNLFTWNLRTVLLKVRIWLFWMCQCRQDLLNDFSYRFLAPICELKDSWRLRKSINSWMRSCCKCSSSRAIYQRFSHPSIPLKPMKIPWNPLLSANKVASEAMKSKAEH